jgi:hypothetical protein
LPLHRLAVQVSFPATHALPQVPQFALSRVRSKQLPAHPLWPGAQQIALVQLLLAHWGLVWQATPLPVGGAQVALVPQTVPAALQVPPAPPQQGWPEPPQAQVDVDAAQVRLTAHGATPAALQHGCPTAPHGITPVALTVNMTVLPETATVTVAVRAPAADAVNVSKSVQLRPGPIAAVHPLLMVSSAGLLLVSVGTLVAMSPPLTIITEVGVGAPLTKLPRVTLAGLADRPAAS